MTAAGNPHRHHTHRLDLDDPTMREWDATCSLADPEQGIVLDRSAFYPGGGGQPPDHGVLLWGGVRTRIVGTARATTLPPAGRGRPRAARRHGVHGGSTTNAVPADAHPLRPACAQRNRVAGLRRARDRRQHGAAHRPDGLRPARGARRTSSSASRRPVNDADRGRPARSTSGCCRGSEALAIPDIIRTATNLLPADIEMVRIVDIDGIDIQADGGTHVASTAMIGRIAVTKMESKGRGFRRLRIQIEDAE